MLGLRQSGTTRRVTARQIWIRRDGIRIAPGSDQRNPWEEAASLSSLGVDKKQLVREKELASLVY